MCVYALYMRRRRGVRRVVAPPLLISIDQPEEIERSFIELMVQREYPRGAGNKRSLMSVYLLISVRQFGARLNKNTSNARQMDG